MPASISPTNPVCPKGHTSTESDYCSECGARMVEQVPAAAAFAPPHHAGAVESCPACGAQRDKSDLVFCEVCGANFTTAAPAVPDLPVPVFPVPAPAPAEPAPLVPEPEPQPPFVPLEPPVFAPNIPAPNIPAPIILAAPAAEAMQVPQQWQVTVAVDPALRHPASPDAPADYEPYTVTLTDPVSLVGRRSQARAIFPHIALQHDDAVSHRHALLQLNPSGGLEIRDIGSSNGTRLNGVELQPMRDYPLHPGDEIGVGHWTRITVGASA